MITALICARCQDEIKDNIKIKVISPVGTQTEKKCSLCGKKRYCALCQVEKAKKETKP